MNSSINNDIELLFEPDITDVSFNKIEFRIIKQHF